MQPKTAREQAKKKQRFPSDTCPCKIESQVPRHPFLLHAKSNRHTIFKQHQQSILVREGFAGQSEPMRQLSPQARRRTTYILRDLHSPGNGRDGFNITPTPARPISFASKCASEAPLKTSLISEPEYSSISSLSLIREPMMSALCTSTTRGISPYPTFVLVQVEFFFF